MDGITFERQQADALAAEFGCDVWTDFRSRADGGEHWHARYSGMAPWEYINGADRDGLRDKLIRHKWLTDQAASLVEEAGPGADAGEGPGLRAVSGP
jgi:hypothetical protein